MWNVRIGGTTAVENAAPPSKTLGTTAVCVSVCDTSHETWCVLTVCAWG